MVKHIQQHTNTQKAGKRKMRGGFDFFKPSTWLSSLQPSYLSQSDYQPSSSFGTSNYQDSSAMDQEGMPGSVMGDSGMQNPSIGMGGKRRGGSRRRRHSMKRGGSGVPTPYNPETIWMQSSSFPQAVGGRRRKTRRHRRR